MFFVSHKYVVHHILQLVNYFEIFVKFNQKTHYVRTLNAHCSGAILIVLKKENKKGPDCIQFTAPHRSEFCSVIRYTNCTVSNPTCFCVSQLASLTVSFF